MRKRVTRRTSERLMRAAYDFEYLSTALKAEGYESIGYGVRHIASELGKLSRALDEELNQEKVS